MYSLLNYIVTATNEGLVRYNHQHLFLPYSPLMKIEIGLYLLAPIE